MNKFLQTASAMLMVGLLSLASVQGQSLPLTFEDSTITYEIFGFGGADFGAIPAAFIENPDPTGANTSATVGNITKPEGAQVWAGASIPLATTIDLSEGSVFQLTVWSPRAGIPFRVKFEDTTSPPNADGNPTIIAEVDVNTTVANEWEVLTYDMSLDAANYDAANNYNQIVLFPDFGTEGAVGGEDFYFDDFLNPSAASISKELASQISFNLFPNPASDMAKVSFDMPITGQTSLTLINVMGQKMADMDLGTLPVGTHQHEFKLQTMPSGIYYMVLAIDGQIVQQQNLLITK